MDTPCTRSGPDRVAPRLGQHSREVLAQAGYEDAEIDAFVSDGVIALAD